MRHQWASVHELAQLGLFHEVPGDVLGRLAAQMPRVGLDPGASLLLDDEAVFVVSGLVTVTEPGEAPRTLRPGDWLAAPELGVRAVIPSTVVRCGRALYEEHVGPLPHSA